ncbi:hypothetical protein BH23ACT10_BH23ACT10_26960 [soil metagenome]
MIRRVVSIAAALVLLLSLAVPAQAHPHRSHHRGHDRGFQTDKDPYLTLAPDAPRGSFLKPIISVGDRVGRFRFEGIPDGIGLAPGRRGTVQTFVAHEQTTVPFFGEADFEDSSVSKLVLDRRARVRRARVALPASAGFIRFCSAFMAGPYEGFRRYTFFVNEESNDVIDVPDGAPYGPDPAVAPQRQAGYTVAYDVRTGRYKQIAGMGRLNHENTVVIPGGWRKHSLWTTDDTFSAGTSQLYMYLTRSIRDMYRDKGSLWAFQVTHDNDGRVRRRDPFNGANDYLDIQPGDDFKGRFIRVPKRIARGNTDLPPQDALEQWSNDNNVFQFIRLEDLATDDHDPRTVYVADTGGTRIVPDPTTGRMVRGPDGTEGFADNGRIFKFEVSRHNPRKVTSFSVFADGDVPETDETYVDMTSPDNLDTSRRSLMVQEDTDNAKILRHDFRSGAWSTVATVNDPDGESSGIVDASRWFGRGAWLVNVQAHGTNVAERATTDENGDPLLLKREDGQLLLMRIRGS